MSVGLVVKPEMSGFFAISSNEVRSAPSEKSLILRFIGVLLTRSDGISAESPRTLADPARERKLRSPCFLASLRHLATPGRGVPSESPALGPRARPSPDRRPSKL